MKKIITILLILISTLTYSQTSFKNFRLEPKQYSFVEYCKMNNKNLQVNKNILIKPRPKRKSENELLVSSTVGYITFIGIMTLSHFSEENNYKGTDNNNKSYAAIVGLLTVSYVLVISIN